MVDLTSRLPSKPVNVLLVVCSAFERGFLTIEESSRETLAFP